MLHFFSSPNGGSISFTVWSKAYIFIRIIFFVFLKSLFFYSLYLLCIVIILTVVFDFQSTGLHHTCASGRTFISGEKKKRLNLFMVLSSLVRSTCSISVLLLPQPLLGEQGLSDWVKEQTIMKMRRTITSPSTIFILIS